MLVLTYAIHLFVGIGVLYLQPMSLYVVLKFIALILICLLTLTAMSSIIVYLQDMHRELHETNNGNKRLLNGMHEGVLIVKPKDDHSVG